MDINDEMHFSPSLKTKDLKTITDNDLLMAYKDRIIKWYILPAKELDKLELGFSSGLIQFSLIDALARYFIKNNRNVGDRFRAFLEKYFEFNSELSKILYDNYRNGLVHQSQIKGNCYFSYLIGNIIYEEDHAIMINPKNLNDKLKEIVDIIFSSENKNELCNTDVAIRIRSDFVDNLED